MPRNRFSDLTYFVFCAVMTFIIMVVAIMSSKVVASEVEEGIIPQQDAFVIGLNINRDYLILVNEQHKYEFGGDYDKALQNDLIYVSDCYGFATPVEKGAYLAFGMLKADLRQLGYEIELYSAYRTEEDQKWVFDNYADMEGLSEQNTVLPAGYSEHHTGLMISYVIWWPDETSKDNQSTWYELTAERLEMNPELAIIRDTLANYGFIERYPAGKEEITGIEYEPFEIRFVGSSQVAHEIMDNELCLEEYLEVQ